MNDAFKAVTRYWDRIMHPEQIISSLPQAVATMLDPADCGPAFIALPQDIQEDGLRLSGRLLRADRARDPAPAPGPRARGRRRSQLLKSRQAPADHRRRRRALFAAPRRRWPTSRSTHGIPVAETIAGKGAVTHDHPAHAGPIGIIGSTSANALAAEADVIVAIGTRLQDFTTGSWTVFGHDAQFISINAARWDATKHRALAVVGDAREIGGGTRRRRSSGWKADADMDRQGARSSSPQWDTLLDELPEADQRAVPTYAQVVGVVNTQGRQATTTMITAAGGLPGETA